MTVETGSRKMLCWWSQTQWTCNLVYLRDAQPRKDLSGESSTEYNRNYDNKGGCGQYGLAGIAAGVADGQPKGNGSSKAWNCTQLSTTLLPN